MGTIGWSGVANQYNTETGYALGVCASVTQALAVGLGVGGRGAVNLFFRGGPTPYSPVSLFTNNEQGLWYNPSNINTYMGGLGSELITNGNFSDGTTGWIAAPAVSNVGGATLSVSSGGLRVTNNATGVNFGLGSQAISCVVGKTYLVTVTRLGQSIPNTVAKWHVGTAPNDAGLATNILANQVTSTATFIAPSTTVYINLGAYENNANAWAEWDNISVKEVTSIANATMFQDVSATIPVTGVEQPVALTLDTRKGEIYFGPEQVVNGNFPVNTDGWSVQAGGTLTWTATGLQVSGSNLWAYQSIPTEIGKRYICSFTPGSNAAQSNFAVGTSIGNSLYIGRGSPIQAPYSFVFVATTTTTFISFRTVVNPVIYTGFSIKESNASVNIVMNPTFASVAGSSWSVNTGWVIGSGVATKTAGTASSITQSVPLRAGRTYRIVYTITRTAGSISPRFSGGTLLPGPAKNISGTYVEHLTALTGNNLLEFAADATFAGTLDNVYMQEVTGNDGYQIVGASRPTLSARYNLLTYTEQFDNPVWLKVNGTSTDVVVTANTVLAPNGSQTADTIVFGAIDAADDFSIVSQVLTLPATQNYTRSIYVKATTPADVGKLLYFYVTDGVLKDVVTVTLTADWQRVTKTLSMASGAGKSFTFGTLGSTYGGANQAAVSADVWGIQVVPENDGVGLPNYQWVNAATDYDTTNFPPYLLYDGVDDHLIGQPSLNLNTNTSDGLAVRNLLTLPAEFGNAAWTKTNSVIQTNLLLQSEAFETATWAKTNSFVQTNLQLYSEAYTTTAGWAVLGGIIPAANVGTAPNTFQTAGSITSAGGTSQALIGKAGGVTTGLTYTFSAYVKQNTSEIVQLSFTSTFDGTNIWANFNVANGTLGSTGTSTISSTIENAGNGWWRCIVTGIATGTIAAGQNTTLIALVDTITSGRLGASAAGSSVYIWGAQLVQGSVAGDYRMTEATAMPVFYPVYNEEITAQKLVATTTNGVHSATQTFTPSSGVTYTTSYYVKKGEYNWCAIELGGTSLISSAYFDLENGVVGTLVNAPTASITSIGDGWYRCSITKTSTGTVSSYSAIFACSANNVASFAGNGSSGIYIGGAQLVQGAVAGDYCKTDGIAVAVAYPNYNGAISAQKLIEDTANTEHLIYSSTLLSATGYSNSIYVKADTRSKVRVGLATGGFAYGASVIADLSNGTLSAITQYGGHTGATASIAPASNDFYRVTITITATPNTFVSSLSLVTGTSTVGYAGDGTSGVYISDAQLEVGSSSTAYQTVGSNAVTVWAGQRKYRDGFNSVVVCSAASTASSGYFVLYASFSTASYRFTNQGTIAANAGTGTFTAVPSTDVLTGIGSISEDIATLKVDGTDIQTINTDQGTGNYRADSQFYFGRLGSVYFQGRVYSLIVRVASSSGIPLTNTQMADTETYVNSITKAY